MIKTIILLNSKFLFQIFCLQSFYRNLMLHCFEVIRKLIINYLAQDL